MTHAQYSLKACLAACLFSIALLLLSPTAAATDKVILQLKWFHQFQFAGYYAAIEQGYYAEEGLEVEVRERNPKQKAVPIDNVLNGVAHFGIADTLLIVERLQGGPVVALAAILQHSPLVLLSLKSSPIKTPADLRGKRIMFTDDVALLAMLDKFNINIQDIQRVPHNFRDDAILESGVDAMSAYLTSQPYFFKQHNLAIDIMSPREYGVNIYGDMLFTSEAYLKNNKAKVQAFRRASLKGWQFALDNPEQVIDWIIERYHSKESRDFLRYEAKMIKQMVESETIELGDINHERLKYITDIYQQMELVPHQVNLHGFHYKDHLTPAR